jgi:hypothetical protein
MRSSYTNGSNSGRHLRFLPFVTLQRYRSNVSCKMKVEDIFYSGAIQTTSDQDQPFAPRKKMEMSRKLRLQEIFFSYISAESNVHANVTSFWATYLSLRAVKMSSPRCVSRRRKG